MPPISASEASGGNPASASPNSSSARTRNVSLAEVVKAARAASLNEEDDDDEEVDENADMKPIFDYDDVQLCYGDEHKESG